jgi:hypothetical protein
MARGNDANAALSDLHGQYGVHPNAESLIGAHRGALDPALERASMSRVNAAATEDLDLSSIEPEGGGTVLAAAVRGGVIVYVAEGEDGRTYKGIAPWGGAKVPSYESVEDKAARGELALGGKIAEKAVAINAEIEAQVAAYRDKLNTEYGQKLASEVEQVQSEQAEQVGEAQEAAASGEGEGNEDGKKLAGSEVSDPSQGGGAKTAATEVTAKATGTDGKGGKKSAADKK